MDSSKKCHEQASSLVSVKHSGDFIARLQNERQRNDDLHRQLTMLVMAHADAEDDLPFEEVMQKHHDGREELEELWVVVSSMLLGLDKKLKAAKDKCQAT